MRAMMAGLLGLCVSLGTAGTAEARSDARPAAQTQAGQTQAARGAPASAPRAAASAARPAASAPRSVAAAPRGGSAARPVVARPGDARQASLRPAVFRTTTVVPDRAARGRAQAAVPYAARPVPTAARGSATASTSCTTRQGRRVCTPRDASLRWTGGLAPAALSQASCPDGTMATNAIGHRDVVRCVPL